MSQQYPTVTRVLTGHTSPETAYVVEDYPYGFRLRCQIRYWVETKKGFGQRFVSQTSNPKRPSLVWNKPKAGVYSAIVVMYLDDNDHVSHARLNGYASPEYIDWYEQTFAEALTEQRERESIRYMRASLRAQSKMTWYICTSIDGGAYRHDPACPGDDAHHDLPYEQRMKEQAAAIHQATRYELWQEAREAIANP